MGVVGGQRAGRRCWGLRRIDWVVDIRGGIPGAPGAPGGGIPNGRGGPWPARS